MLNVAGGVDHIGGQDQVETAGCKPLGGDIGFHIQLFKIHK